MIMLSPLPGKQPLETATKPTGSLSISSGRTVTVTCPVADTGRGEQFWDHEQRGWDGWDMDEV